ncbi:DUF7344 domain-containing protein [Natronorubrum texcoconense]|uniref:DUF7344 domain-containing protein n=1 Tax=Natronorubrum texcoconense TaxID=1095776 RepID=A0A1G9BYX3_9EURY|nr:hypothetical protein [Natronorubrum texcoconense]SDK44676.1 hypothetical protein SAMN04515672_3142 [Natronorubrum texcoconense]
MLDLTFQILSNKQRRQLLTKLLESRNDTGVCVPEEVVDEDQQLEEATLELRHRHLPLLEEAQFVEWNSSRHTVERGAKFGEIRPLLRLLTTNPHNLPGEWT